jgi:hypothetical protein
LLYNSVVLNVWQFVLAKLVEFTLLKMKISKNFLKAFVTKYQNSATQKILVVRYSLKIQVKICQYVTKTNWHH